MVRGRRSGRPARRRPGRACRDRPQGWSPRQRGFRSRRALLLQRHARARSTPSRSSGSISSAFSNAATAAGKITALAQRLPELVLNAGVGRVGGSHGPQVLQRGVQIAFLPQSHPQVQVGGQAVWLQRQRLLKHRDGLGEVTALGQHGSEIRVGPPVFRDRGRRPSGARRSRRENRTFPRARRPASCAPPQTAVRPSRRAGTRSARAGSRSAPSRPGRARHAVWDRRDLRLTAASSWLTEAGGFLDAASPPVAPQDRAFIGEHEDQDGNRGFIDGL